MMFGSKAASVVVLLLLGIGPVMAQEFSIEERVDALEVEVSSLRNLAEDSSAALFLFGVFCALWAQNTGRRPWLWFFLGLFFSVITVLVLLWKNSRDLRARA